VHESAGHLGIFVSASVARKEYGEFSDNIDLIDVLPPGLYEAVFEQKGTDTKNPDLVTGGWVMRCEPRTLEDIRALGGNDAADERRFATAARVSEVNLAAYRTFVQPFVRAMASEPLGEWLRRMHPLRLQYELLSDKNPWMAPLAATAKMVREHRRPVAGDNPLLQAQDVVSDAIVTGLNAWRDLSETVAEQTFLAVFGSPALQVAVGIDPAGTEPLRKAGKTPLHRQLVDARVAELKSRIGTGGVPEGAVRILIHAGTARGSVDERGFEAIRRMRDANPGAERLTLAAFKTLVREQSFMLQLDEEAALAALPALIPAPADRVMCIRAVQEVLAAGGEITDEMAARLRRIGRLLDLEKALVAAQSKSAA
jgi:hypothetical protein